MLGAVSLRLARVGYQLFSLRTKSQPPESPEKISHLSFLVSTPEFFKGRAGIAEMSKQMEYAVCRAQIMLADGGQGGLGVPDI